MLKAINPAPAEPINENASPALNNPAVSRCFEVWKTARQESMAKGKTEYSAEKVAALAYCAAMPLLSGYQNISDFIACVGFCMALEMIPEEKAAVLLSAARIAHSTTAKEPKQAKRRPAAA